MIDYERPFELIRRIGKLGVCLEQDDCLDELKEIIEQLVKERDSAIKDMVTVADDNMCAVCKSSADYPMSGKCRECYLGDENNFEWRGVHD